MLAGGESGVALLRDGQVRPLRTADRNRLSGITGLLRRPGGDLWMNGVNGIFHVSAGELGKGLGADVWTVVSTTPPTACPALRSNPR